MYECRVTRMTRSYLDKGDLAPTGTVVDVGEILKGVRIARVGSVDMMQIQGTGEWIPVDVLEYREIDSDDSESMTRQVPTTVDLHLSITGSRILIYETCDSSTPISHGLANGNRLRVDRVYKFNNGGNLETRYRIVEVVNGDDESVIGHWIVSDYTSSASGQSVVRRLARAAGFGRNSVADDLLNSDLYNDTEREGSFSSGRGRGDGFTGGDRTIVSTDSGEGPVVAMSLEKNLEEIYDQYGFTYDSKAITNGLMGTPIGRLIFVHGMPFQYTYITDRRSVLDSSKYLGAYGADQSDKITAMNRADADLYGRSFAAEIAANMPIATIVPGIPKFISSIKEGVFGGGYSSKDVKNGWMPFFTDLSDVEANDALQKLVAQGGDYDYFTMEINTTEYFEYVNALCRTSAKLMGIAHEVVWIASGDGSRPKGAVTAENFDWGNYNKSAEQDFSTLEEVTGISGGVNFAFDPLSSITDSLSNSAGPSQFERMLEGLSSSAREADFVFGEGVGAKLARGGDAYSAAIPQYTEGNGILAGVRNATDRAIAIINNTAKGLNMRFPEIWQDSSSSKSYSIEMRFIAPYATPFCKWRYVLVPFFHAFALAAPQSPTTIMAYGRPFLIRAFSKGYFNVEMGIVESISWKRFGDGDMISADGVPTQIDVTMEFRDLYHSLSMSKIGDLTSMSSISVFFNNTGLMDMIGTLSGVNMNRINMAERLALYASSAIGMFGATFSNFMRHFSDRVANITYRYLYGL